MGLSFGRAFRCFRTLCSIIEVSSRLFRCGIGGLLQGVGLLSRVSYRLVDSYLFAYYSYVVFKSIDQSLSCDFYLAISLGQGLSLVVFRLILIVFQPSYVRSYLFVSGLLPRLFYGI